MAQVKDPVCGMMVDSDTAPARSAYQGRAYYFCSDVCLRQFESDRKRYVNATNLAESAPVEELEKHEPPFTKAGGFIAPKFGTAGSGGLEYERFPEAHENKE